MAGPLLAADATTGVRPGTIPMLSESDKRNIIRDTAEIVGIVKYVNRENKMLVMVKTPGDETVYYGDTTEFPPNSRDKILLEGAKIRAWCVMVGMRKFATRIELQ
jgi:hypothetical protein